MVAKAKIKKRFVYQTYYPGEENSDQNLNFIIIGENDPDWEPTVLLRVQDGLDYGLFDSFNRGIENNIYNIEKFKAWILEQKDEIDFVLAKLDELKTFLGE